MKPSLVKIDHFTPLLTDTLPYEVPFFFSNVGIYKSLKKAYDVYFKGQNKKKAKGEKDVNSDISLIDFFTKEYFSESKQLQNLIEAACSSGHAGSIPYEYQIKNTDRGRRNISLIHPAAQIKICDLYKKHKNVILFYCGRSPYSIRYPSKVTSRTVRKHASILNNIFKEPESANISDLKEKVVKDQRKFSLFEIPNSYFVLEKYRMLHDFYESSDILDLEKKFLNCRRVDIQRCFESIYTHSISWAVKDKEYVKKNLYAFSGNNLKLFEAEFDKLMQFSNYNETNGIPIGAETSRLFSEIILQKIDLNIQKHIETNPIDGKQLTKGRDFEIKRYMDDFFIFTNDEHLSERIQQVCEDELKGYKLFVNQNKTISFDRPFVTSTSLAKKNVGALLNEYLKTFESKEDISTASKHSPTYEGSLRVINKIRGIIRDHDLHFYNVSNIALWILKKDLLKTLDRLQKQKEIKKAPVSGILGNLKNIFNITFCGFYPNYIQKQKEAEEVPASRINSHLKRVVDIAFYIFHLSPRSHTASSIFKICYIILEILKVVNDEKIAGEIKQEISNKILIFCEKISHSQDEKIFEFLDLILFLSQLQDNFEIKKERLKEIFDIENSSLSYFEIVVLLSYIENVKDKSSYSEIRDTIIKSCNEKLSTEGALKKTENFLLFFDLIKCPYLEESEKRKILEWVGIKRDKKEVISFIEKKGWFFDWEKQENLDIRSVLEIKEARLGY